MKKSKVVKWMKLVYETDRQRGRMQHIGKKWTRISLQMCPWYCKDFSETDECKQNCEYHYINSLYMQMKRAYDNACDAYQDLLTQRKAAWQDIFAQKEK